MRNFSTLLRENAEYAYNKKHCVCVRDSLTQACTLFPRDGRLVLGIEHLKITSYDHPLVIDSEYVWAYGSGDICLFIRA